MPAVCRRIAKDMRARYTLGYIPAESPSRSDLRPIRVRVTAPGHDRLKVLTRTRWNRRRAAEELQISYKALLYKLKQIGYREYGAS